MVDFKKRLTKSSGDKHQNPFEIYEWLDRASDKGPLRPAQIAVLEEWHRKRRAERDIILKLNTGQGKTLVGLLMLQSKMNENEGCSLYLCPNHFLVSQTVAQASQFGIKCVTTEGELPAEFLDGKAILVTLVHKLFNGLSKFKLGAQSLPVANVVVDDAHACIDAIKDSYTIKLDAEHTAYQELLDLFSRALEEQGPGTLADIRRNVFGAFLPVPYWEWMDRHQEVVNILGKYAQDDSVKFAWPLLRDIFQDCLCIISGQSLEISPYRPPLQMFGSYAKAKHRIFMSATITDDAFLIKGLGLSEETVKSPLVYKDEKWSGEKMILIPSLIDASLTDTEITHAFAGRSPKRKSGVVVLCPSFSAANIWEAEGAHIATGQDIHERIEMLKNGACTETLVIVNRYDGIDLPDSACRLLIMDSKPFSEDLLDQYTEVSRQESEVVAVRTARIVEQGLGRSVRGEKDYSVIVLTGSDLVRCINSRQSRQYFSAQTRAQIEIGMEVAELARYEITEDTEPMRILANVIGQCLRRDEGWKDFYIERMNEIRRPESTSKVLHLFSAEMKAENRYHDGDCEGAARILQQTVDACPEARVDEGWYFQEMARYMYPASKTRSNELQVAAHRRNHYLLRPRDGMVFTKIKVVNPKRMENIADYVKKFGSFQELNLAIDEMLAALRFGVRAEVFERAFNDLAPALGFEGQRPDKEWKEGPDNLWGVRDNEYLLVECKSEVALDRAEITRDESGQMNNASAWFKQNYPGATAKRIMIIPTHTLARGAGFNDEVQIMWNRQLKRLVENVRTFYNEFRNLDFHGLSEAKIQELINTHSLGAEHLLHDYSEPAKVY